MQTQENHILLLFGVLLNTSKSDAHAYVRGLLESSCKARENSWYGLVMDGERWIYEIHEGGEGLSLLPGILAAHKEGRPNPVFRLSNNKLVEVSPAGDEIFGLVMPEESFGGEATDYASFPKGKRLTPYLGDGKHYLVAGVVSLVRGSYQRTRLTQHGFARGYLRRTKSVKGCDTDGVCKVFDAPPDPREGRIVCKSGAFRLRF